MMLSTVSPGLLQRLREVTAELHQSVEKRVDLVSPDFDLPRYVLLLKRFYGFWAPIEASLQQVPGLFHPALAIQTRMKAHMLRADLETFDVDSVLVAFCPRLPDLRTFERALGCMYVLEGSTLGARIVARVLRERWGIDNGSGATFFNAYGTEVGTRWAEFRTFLISQVDPVNSDALLSAAVETFDTFDQWLAVESQFDS